MSCAMITISLEGSVSECRLTFGHLALDEGSGGGQGIGGVLELGEVLKFHAFLGVVFKLFVEVV